MDGETRGQTRQVPAETPTTVRLAARSGIPLSRMVLQQSDFRFQRGRLAFIRIDLIKTGRSEVVFVPLDKFGQRIRIELATGNSQARGQIFRGAEYAVGNGDGSFHELKYNSGYTIRQEHDGKGGPDSGTSGLSNGLAPFIFLFYARLRAL